MADIADLRAWAPGGLEAGGSLRAVQEALRETEELAGRCGYRIGDDGSIQDIAPDDAIDDGSGTTLVGASFAGLAHGADTTTLPPPDGATPAANNAYWDALSVADRQDILDHHPEWVGNLDGVPAAIPDQANRAPLTGELAKAQEELQWAADAKIRLGMASSDDVQADLAMTGYYDEALARRDFLAAVHSTIGQEGRSLLVLDTSGEMVKTAVAIGDVDTADHVTVHVPGMTTTVDRSLDGKDSPASCSPLSAPRC